MPRCLNLRDVLPYSSPSDGRALSRVSHGFCERPRGAQNSAAAAAQATGTDVHVGVRMISLLANF